MAATLVVASLFAYVAPANASTGSMCDFAVFIGVRGTGAPAGTGSTHSGRVWTSGGMGDQVALLASDVRNESYPTYFESLNYPATAVNYEQSVRAGTAALVTELNWLSTACGSILPTVILAGHSQGAHVIGDALENKPDTAVPALTARAKAMIGAVTLFGDPTYGVNAENAIYNAPGSPNAYGRLWKIRDGLQQYRYWGWGQGQTDPNPRWVPRIRSYCLSGDFFCTSNNGDSNFAIHNSYKSTFMSQATSWITYSITSQG